MFVHTSIWPPIYPFWNSCLESFQKKLRFEISKNGFKGFMDGSKADSNKIVYDCTTPN